MISKLLGWEEHTRQNMIDGQPWGGMITYWRRCDKVGREVITLFPEGLDKSRCWCWEINDYEFCGSHDDFNGAQNDADNRAREVGYQI